MRKQLHYKDLKYFFPGGILLGLVVLIAMCIQIHNRPKDISYYNKREITVDEYDGEKVSPSFYELTEIYDTNGGMYSFERGKYQIRNVFTDNVKKGSQLTIYIDSFGDIYGIQDADHVYIDIQDYIYEQIPVPYILAIIFIVVVILIFTLGYVLYLKGFLA